MLFRAELPKHRFADVVFADVLKEKELVLYQKFHDIAVTVPDDASPTCLMISGYHPYPLTTAWRHVPMRRRGMYGSPTHKIELTKLISQSPTHEVQLTKSNSRRSPTH